MDYDVEIPLDLREDDLDTNPSSRVPVAMVLDVSGSMSGDPINELNEGIKLFFKEVKADEVARDAVEVGIITFGNIVRVELDFTPIIYQEPPYLAAGGSTPMGEAVNLALNLLDKRKSEYKEHGVDYYQPWMVLMTDGQPTDDITGAARRTSTLAREKKLSIFPIAIGPNADLNTLRAFSPLREPLRLKGLNFRSLFEWLSKSVSSVSHSTPGESVPLSPPSGWAEV